MKTPMLRFTLFLLIWPTLPLTGTAQVVSIDPSSVESPVAGQQLTLNINITGGMNVVGYQVTVTFDSTALSYVSIANGDYLPAGEVPVPPVVTNTSVEFVVVVPDFTASSDETGTLATVTFTVVEAKDSAIGLEAGVFDLVRGALIVVTAQGGMVTSIAQEVSIPDPNLRAAVAEELGKAAGDTITTDDMVTLTKLEVRNTNIGDLTGLEHATKLTRLRLGDNAITDISPVAGLTNLTELNLSGNRITTSPCPRCRCEVHNL